MARSFNGSSDAITLSASAAGAVSGFPISMSAWYKPTVSLTTNQALIFANTTALTHYVTLSYGNGTANFNMAANGCSAMYGPGTVGALGVWHHGAFRLVGATTAAVFLDGAKNSTFAGGSATTPGSNLVANIGAANTGSLVAFAGGSLAEAGVWTAALTDGEILALSLGARCNTIRPQSLIWYLPLDGLQSPEPDFSGNAFNGTLTGTALASGPPLMQFTPRWPQFLTPPVSAVKPYPPFQRRAA